MTGRSVHPTAVAGAAWLALVLCAAASAPAAENTEAQIQSRRCLNCHGQEHIAQLNAQERAAMLAPSDQPRDFSAAPGPRPTLLVDLKTFEGTAHAKASCVDCHSGITSLPHGLDVPPASCNDTCHTQPHQEFTDSAHAKALAEGNPMAPTCGACHGSHDIVGKDNRSSRVHPINVTRLCADCHRQHHEPTPAGHEPKPFVDEFLESVHGKALSGSGLVVAANCVSCHGAHKVLPADSPGSYVNRGAISKTCGHCHVVAAEQYESSIHGKLAAEGSIEAPVCTDCHTAHSITRSGEPAFMLDIANECGQCHNKPRVEGGLSLYESYRRSYHGQVTALGYERAARCSDCHGAHDILPASDPLSRIAPGENRLAMCASCHEGANANFALFEPHADFYDSERYPILYAIWLYFVVVMSATFTFFGMHSLLWFVRSSYDRLKHGPPPRHHGAAHGIQRFNRVDRVNHAFVVITFFGLTLTGMPLFFAEHAWADLLASMLGGPRMCGLLHRVFAVMLFVNFAVHAWEVVQRARRGGVKKMLIGPYSMFPRWKDVTDTLGMVKWFFGARQRPRFDRWTYWEKFDYWAEVFGTGVIGGTGLLLWFPEFFSNFMPGWMFNVATIIHGYEALLAVGFIFTIHFFNAHLRWEKFPVDDVMFTGQLPEEEFKHERPEEYERLVQSGELAQLRVPPAPPHYRKIAVSVGVAAMIVGTTMVALIVLAGLNVI